MQAQNYSIKEWAPEDRPREKMKAKGASYLSDTELLAILIGNGIPKRSALDLARELMNLGKNDLRQLGKLTLNDFMTIKGVGAAKAVTICAALELGRRRQSQGNPLKQLVKTSNDMASYIQPLLSDHRHEVFGVVFLNRANCVKHFEVISEGGITGTVADPRIIMKKALSEDAVALILFHNHPSGNLKPSRADEQITTKIAEAARLFDIRVLDHLIVSEEGYFSFADEGLI